MRNLLTLSALTLLACASTAPAPSARTTRALAQHSEPEHRHPQQAAPPLPAWGAPELLDAINRRRQDRGAQPLRIDRGLCVVAERANDAYQRLGRGSEQHVLAWTNQDLQGSALSFERVITMVLFFQSPAEAQQLLSAALDPRVLYAGVAISQVPPPMGGRGGYSVVMALGQ